MLSTLKAGTVIDSRYEIVEHLGDGGMGSVFKALELGLERFVALKMLHPSLIGDSEHRERFKREGALLATLEHPHIIRCFRFGVWNETFPYIAMEFLSGESLSRVIGADCTLGTARVLTIGKQICDAMQYAHESKIIHRDLKPANILLTGTENQDFVKVLDFGMARLLPAPNQVSQHLTQTGELIGSVHYMSPEQCLGKKSDARSDIYSLGCLLYEALAGGPPLVADAPVRVIQMHVHDYPAPLEKCFKKALPPGLNSVLMRAMAKNPKDRYQSMSELKAALELVAEGRGKEISIFPPDSERATARSRKPPVYLVGFSVVALLVLTAVPTFNKKESAPFPFSRSTSSAVSKVSPLGEFSQSPLSRYHAAHSVLSSGEVEKLEQGTARLQSYIDCGKDTVSVSTANAMLRKLKALESVYWSQKRYDDWYAITERLLNFELIASTAIRSRCDQLAEISEGASWLSLKTGGLPEAAKWQARVRRCREQLKELEKRADDPASILTLGLTNSVQCAREGHIPKALDEMEKALNARGVSDLLAGDSTATYYWARLRVEDTMLRLMNSAVCKSDEDVVALCRMVMRLATICGKSRTELAAVSEFCRERLKKAFPDGKIVASLRSGYDDLASLLNILGATSDEVVTRDLVDLSPGFDVRDAAKVLAKLHYYADWVDKYGRHASLSSVRAHCYLSRLYYPSSYEAGLAQSKIAVSEFEQIAKNAGVKAATREEFERTAALVSKSQELATSGARGTGGYSPAAASMDSTVIKSSGRTR